MDCVHELTIYVYTCLHILFYSPKRMCSGSCYTSVYPENNIKSILLLTLYFFTKFSEDALYGYMGFFSCLKDNSRTNATSEDLPILRRTSRLRNV